MAFDLTYQAQTNDESLGRRGLLGFELCCDSSVLLRMNMRENHKKADVLTAISAATTPPFHKRQIKKQLALTRCTR